MVRRLISLQLFLILLLQKIVLLFRLLILSLQPVVLFFASCIFPLKGIILALAGVILLLRLCITQIGLSVGRCNIAIKLDGGRDLFRRGRTCRECGGGRHRQCDA